jgi:predicted MPP superfamily phosphohydrolase
MFWFVRTVALLAAPGVLFAWAVSAFPWLSRAPHRKRWLAGILIALLVIDRGSDLLVVYRHSHEAGLIHAYLVLLFATFILAGLPLGLLYAGFWAARRLRAAGAASSPNAPIVDAAAAAAVAPSALPPASPALVIPAMTRRQWVEGIGGTALLGATGGMLGWGMARGRHAFELREVAVRVKGLPRALDGYVIAQVSDLHTGAFVGEPELDEGLSLVRQAKPDLVVVTGDVVDFDPGYAPLAARKLAALPARDGVFAALGNHDYYAGADRVLATLTAAGIDVLRNDGRRIRPGDGGGFALLGVDDLAAEKRGLGGPRLAKAAAAVPPGLPQILLSHQPNTVDRWPGAVAVQLSGHTHGGQINPGFSPAGLLMKYVAGLYDVGGTTLYVNSGFGTVGAPSRVGAPPEVTRLVLVAA